MSVAETKEDNDSPDIEGHIWRPEEDILGDIYASESNLTAVRNAELDSAGDINSGENGVGKSEIGEVGDIQADRIGIKNSEIGKAGHIDAEKDGIRGSEVDEVGDINVERHGITDNQGENRRSEVGQAGDINAKKGIRNSIVDQVGDITSKHSAIEDSEVGQAGVLKSENWTVKDSTVESIEAIESESIAIKDSTVGEVGDITSEGTAVGSSEVSRIDGDIITEASAFHDSEIDEVYGSITAQSFNETEGFFENPRDNSLPDFGDWRNTEEWIGGEKESRGSIFNKTDLPYTVADEIVGKELDRDSYGGFIAADSIDVTDFNDNMFVVTPDSSDQFIDYEGDWTEFKSFLKDSDNLMEGLSTFNPDIDTIEGRDHLLELENHYSELLEDFSKDELRENLRYVQAFSDGLEDEQFIEILDKARDTMQTAEKEKVKEFGEVFSSLPGDLQDEFVSTLEKRKDSHVGKDLFNIGQKRKYDQFLDGEEEYEITKMMDGGNSVIEGLSSISKPASAFEAERLRELPAELAKDRKIPDPLGNWLKDRYLSMRDGRFQDLMRDIGRKEEYGELPEIDDGAFEEDSPYREMLEDALEQYDDEMRFLTHLAEAAGEDYDPDFNLKSKEGRRQHDPNFDPEEDEDFESLWEHVQKEAEKDISNKERAYLIESIQNLGKKIAREEYQEAIDSNQEKEEFTEDEVAALHAHSGYHKNTEAVEKILDPEVDPDQLEENQEWLEQNGFQYEDLAGFEEETYEVEAEQSLEKTINNKREELLDEMQGLADELGNYDVQTVEDVEQLRDQVERPSDAEEQEVYDELFKEKIDEYRGIEDQVEGVPDEITVRPAEPLEAMQMGSHFTNSCLAIGKSNGWSAAANALDANKQVLYAEDEDGEVVGRLLTAVTEDGRLEDYKVYNNSAADIDDPMDEYVDRFADHLGLERVPEDERVKDVEVLAAEDWYSSVIY